MFFITLKIFTQYESIYEYYFEWCGSQYTSEENCPSQPILGIYQEIIDSMKPLYTILWKAMIEDAYIENNCQI